MLKTVITLENTILDIKQTIESQFSKADQLSNENEQLETASTQLERKIQQQEEKQVSLAGDLQGLALVQSTLKQASISTPKTTNTIRDEEVAFQLIVITLFLLSTHRAVCDRFGTVFLQRS